MLSFLELIYETIFKSLDVSLFATVYYIINSVSLNIVNLDQLFTMVTAPLRQLNIVYIFLIMIFWFRPRLIWYCIGYLC